MAIRRSRPAPGPVAPEGSALIGLITEVRGRESVRYFSSEQAADEALATGTVDEALALAGAWSDLDWGDMASALDRARHEVAPSPSISV